MFPLSPMKLEKSIYDVLNNKNIYKTIIFPYVLYGCVAWSLTLRGKFRLKVVEHRILRQIFRLKRDPNGEWNRLHNEELQSLIVHLI